MKNIENLPEQSGIYMVINLINNKQYIGQSVNIKQRFLSNHQYDFKNPNNSSYNSKFYKALRKYGWENFAVIVLELCDKNKLDKREIYYIQKYDTFKNGYNSTTGGQNWSPNIHSKEAELKRKNTRDKNNSLKSENHPRAKLTNEEVILIRKRYINGELIDSIYKDYQNLYSSKETFKRIVLGYTYKDAGCIPQQEHIRHTNSKLTADQVRNIRKEYEKGKISYAKLGKKYGISGTAIANVIKGITYTHID